ncbi:MAG: MmgE/PrpD family protein [Dehalococcoidales bacterium]|nr:MmgE/PrpD family protein [Dehalococcoidales bacterium]
MITERISHFVTETVASDIPPEAMELARIAITDFCGVALAGSKEKPAQILVDYARNMGGKSQASTIGSSFKTSLYLAALVNGTTGHSLDYDDIAVSLIGHPSVFLVPAILAVGESLNSSGEDILTAYIIGYETACHVAKPILQSHYVQGWHSTATFGSLGAAASVSWLKKINAGQVKNALGIAASLAGGLRQNFGTMTKPLHAGKAAANGIQAVLLAEAGFTADEKIIEAPLGFARVFGHSDEVDWSTVSDNLGKVFLITSTEGLSMKPYPSCGFTHTAIDAALYIKREYGVDASSIAEVELGVSPFDKQILIHHQPKTGLEGKFSLEYCVARALISGEVRLRHFSEDAVADAAVKNIIEKMKWVEKFPMPEMGTPSGFGTKSVTVKLKDGREYYKEIDIAKGAPMNPMTDADLQSKYRDCASVVLDKERVEKSLSLLNGLSKIKNISALAETLTGP